MQAIETQWRGYRFRSRLEARWAVFFDSMGIEFWYEPEGYRFQDGTMYLPDFYLPVVRMYGYFDEHRLYSNPGPGERDSFETTSERYRAAVAASRLERFGAATGAA